MVGDVLYKSDGATTTTWTATVGPDLASVNAQSVSGDTTGIAAGNMAAETVFDSTNAGWTSDGISKATLSSGTFTLRLVANLGDAGNGNIAFDWTSGSQYVRLDHSSINSIKLTVRGLSLLRTFIPAGIIGNWALIDLYVNPGTGVTARVNGTETVFSDVNVQDITAGGTAGDIGIGSRSDGAVPCNQPQAFLGLGIVSGDLGLARHNADVAALDL